LGEFRLTSADGVEAAGLTKIHRAVLAYLVLSRRPRHPRSKLAGLFWPSRIDALHSLSQSLNLLRKALNDQEGSIIVPKSDPLICRFDSLNVDALLFESLVSQGSPEALERAEALYGADLLDGLDVKLDEFNRWLDSERERLRGIAVDGLCRLTQLRAEAGLPQRALETARRVLNLDELCEEAHRAIMRSHLKIGQYAAARQHAQYFDDLFRRKAIAAHPATQALLLDVRRHSLGEPATSVAPVADGVLAASPRDEGTRPADVETCSGAVPAVTRKLAAILAADVVGYSRLMEQDEADTFNRLRTHHKALFEPEIAKRGGCIFKLMGDGLFAEFGSVVDAVECAVALQRKMAERNNEVPEDRRIEVRIGLHVGDVIVEANDRHGNTVNVAARLQQLSEPGGICVSRPIVEHVKHKVALRFELKGEERLKNIAEPLSVYRVAIDAEVATGSSRARGPARMLYAVAAMALLVVAGAGASWYFNGRTAPPPSEIPAVYPQPAPTSGTAEVSPSRSEATATTMAPAPMAGEGRPALPADEGIPVIAVLPFEDLTGDQIQSDLGRGIAEAFINDLSTFPDFEVVSSTTSFRLFDKTVPQIVAATGALFVVGGSIRRTRDKILIAVQLIRGSTDRQLKIAQLEATTSDPVALQSTVSGRIRDELGGLTGALRSEYEKIAWAKPEADLTEYDYYIRGHRHHLRFTVPEVQRGREVWEQGLARFPNSALLRCKLSFSFHFLGSQDGTGEGHKTADRLVAEAEAMRKKSRLDEWQCRWASSRAFTRRGDLRGAVAEVREARAMAPYDSSLHAYGASLLLKAGLYDEAVEWARFAVTHDANPPQPYFDTLFDAYYASRRMQEAVDLAEMQIQKPSPAKWWYAFLQKAYTANGQMKKAEEVRKRLSELQPAP
jgi:class 3 adenylate cyclase/TolB-like protein